jgi:hypothetical protein
MIRRRHQYRDGFIIVNTLLFQPDYALANVSQELCAYWGSVFLRAQ